MNLLATARTDASVPTGIPHARPVIVTAVDLVQGAKGYIMPYRFSCPMPSCRPKQFWGVILCCDGSIKACCKPGSVILWTPPNTVLKLLSAESLWPGRGPAQSPPDQAGKTIAGRHHVLIVYGVNWEPPCAPAGGWPAYSPQSRNLVGLLMPPYFCWGVPARRSAAGLDQSNGPWQLLSDSRGAIN